MRLEKLGEARVANRMGEGAQRKRCWDPRCSPRGNPACRATFGGRRKAVRDRFALQGGTTSWLLGAWKPNRFLVNRLDL